MIRRRADLGIRVAAVALVPMLAWAVPQAALAQGQRISLPAMPLEDALAQIRQQTGATIDADPDAIRGLTAAPVREARDVLS